MKGFDVTVTGGNVVTAWGEVQTTIGIISGKVAALLDPATPVKARVAVDANGKTVLPGLVDAHVHFREPGLAHKEGFETGTKAAAAGGVTTVMVQPTDDPVTALPHDFIEKRRLAEGRAYVDYALQVCVGEELSHIKTLADMGAVSFELFLAYPAPPHRITSNDLLLACLERIADVGAVAGIDPSDQSIVDGRTARIQASGARDPSAFLRSRPPVAEAYGTVRACVAAQATKARVHLRQLSCRTSVDLLDKMRDRCSGLSAEVCPHYLVLSEEDFLRQGYLAKMAPPLRSQDDIEALWRALSNRVVDIVATDHAPHLPEEKAAGRDDIWMVPNGIPGLQTFLPLMLDQVARGRLTLQDLVRTCSETPARLFDLYPRKGCLQPGSDADLVIVDPARSMMITNDNQYSKARNTPFAGWSIQGCPVLTMVRGHVVMSDGRIEGSPLGEFVAPSR